MVMPIDDMPTHTLPFQPAHEIVLVKRYERLQIKNVVNLKSLFSSP